MAQRLKAMGKAAYRNGFDVTLQPDRLGEPQGWRKHRTIFVCSMADLFHRDVPDDFIAQVFQVMADCPQHTFQLLTKRPERMAQWFHRWWKPEKTHTFCRHGKPHKAPNLFLRQQACSECRSFFLGCLRGRNEWKDEPVTPNFRATGKVDWWHRPDHVCDGFRWNPRGDQHGVAVELTGGYISVRQDALSGAFPAPLSNVWLGVTVEDASCLWRIDKLMECAAAVRFVSCEPLLGSVDLSLPTRTFERSDGTLGCAHCCNKDRCDDASHLLRSECPYCRGTGKARILDWIICGGETGPGARPMHPDWARALRDQCQAAVVPYFFKGWGQWFPDEQFEAERQQRPDSVMLPWDVPDSAIKTIGVADTYYRVGKKKAGRLLDGREWNEMPALSTAEGAGVNDG